MHFSKLQNFIDVLGRARERERTGLQPLFQQTFLWARGRLKHAAKLRQQPAHSVLIHLEKLRQVIKGARVSAVTGLCHCEQKVRRKRARWHPLKLRLGIRHAERLHHRKLPTDAGCPGRRGWGSSKHVFDMGSGASQQPEEAGQRDRQPVHVAAANNAGVGQRQRNRIVWHEVHEAVRVAPGHGVSKGIPPQLRVSGRGEAEPEAVHQLLLEMDLGCVSDSQDAHSRSNAVHAMQAVNVQPWHHPLSKARDKASLVCQRGGKSEAEGDTVLAVHPKLCRASHGENAKWRTRHVGRGHASD
mmetsp:Transcript_12635/g.25119  ORF Transcript_12635/g.25119 Transcript_12635/m.25119 type:complete len:300 (-) Transcript_12635:1048-1947(-)